MEKNMIAVIDNVFRPHHLDNWKENINRSTDNFVSGVLDKEGEGCMMQIVNMTTQ